MESRVDFKIDMKKPDNIKIKRYFIIEGYPVPEIVPVYGFVCNMEDIEIYEGHLLYFNPELAEDNVLSMSAAGKFFETVKLAGSKREKLIRQRIDYRKRTIDSNQSELNELENALKVG